MVHEIFVRVKPQRRPTLSQRWALKSCVLSSVVFYEWTIPSDMMPFFSNLNHWSDQNRKGAHMMGILHIGIISYLIVGQ